MYLASTLSQSRNTTATRASEACWTTKGDQKGKACDIPECNETYGGNPGKCPACNGGWCDGGYCRTCGGQVPDRVLPTAVNNPTVPAPNNTGNTQPVSPTAQPVATTVPTTIVSHTQTPQNTSTPQNTTSPQSTSAPQNTQAPQVSSVSEAPVSTTPQPTQIPVSQVPQTSPVANTPVPSREPAAPQPSRTPEPMQLRIQNQDSIPYRVNELKICISRDDCIVQQVPDNTRTVGSGSTGTYSLSGFCTQGSTSVTAYAVLAPQRQGAASGPLIALQKEITCGSSGEIVIRQQSHADPTVAPPSPAPDPQSSFKTPTILSRSSWNAKAPDASRTPTEQSRISRVIYHHIGSGAGLDYSIRTVQDVHMRNEKYDRYDIAYHYIISADGSIYTGRSTRYCTTTGTTDPKYVPPNGAACGSIQVMIVGDFDVYKPTAKQVESLIQLSTWLLKRYNLQTDDIYGHRDFITDQVYTCPGKNLYNYKKNGLEYFREQINTLL